MKTGAASALRQGIARISMSPAFRADIAKALGFAPVAVSHGAIAKKAAELSQMDPKMAGFIRSFAAQTR
jgi:hypothetical protein